LFVSKAEHKMRKTHNEDDQSRNCSIPTRFANG
jgi:hypothetical protein